MPKRVIIVGSGPGLARTVAERFGGEGWRVVMMARNIERLESEAAALMAKGMDAVPVPCDVLDLERLDALIRREGASGGIDLLNYNAAVIRPDTPILETPIEAIQSDLTIDLTAAIVAARAAIPAMRARGSGTILFSGGNLGFDPWPQYLTLGVGKAGLRNAAGALAKDPACAALRIAYVNIHAHITGEVNDELADLYYKIHTQPAEQHEWDVHYEHAYEMPTDV